MDAPGARGTRAVVLVCLLTLAATRVRAQFESWELGGDYLFKSLGFLGTQEPVDSSQNPDNVLGVPALTAEQQFRLDLDGYWGPFRCLLKPRFSILWSRWDEGPREGEDETDTDSFLNEHELSVALWERLYLAYARENLQWGPSALLSPTNPFLRDNGQRNPKREVDGTDFGKALWVVDSSWSLLAAANIDEGEQDPIHPFERSYALKLDHTGFERYGAAVLSYREAPEGVEDHLARTKAGGYANWTVSDATLVHVEGVAQLRSDALYPAADPDAYYGAGMRPVRAHANDLAGIALAGGSYTFAAGPTLTVEYAYNAEGYSDGEADRYYALRQAAADGLDPTEQVAAAAASAPDVPPALMRIDRVRRAYDAEVARVKAETEAAVAAQIAASTDVLTDTLDPGLRLLRRNYVLLQYHQAEIWNRLAAVLRCVVGLDDGSCQLIPILQYDVGGRWQVFATGIHNIGSGETEFGSVARYAYSVGLEFSL